MKLKSISKRTSGRGASKNTNKTAGVRRRFVNTDQEPKIISSTYDVYFKSSLKLLQKMEKQKISSDQIFFIKNVVAMFTREIVRNNVRRSALHQMKTI